jgi:hypothetical protein
MFSNADFLDLYLAAKCNPEALKFSKCSSNNSLINAVDDSWSSSNHERQRSRHSFVSSSMSSTYTCSGVSPGSSLARKLSTRELTLEMDRPKVSYESEMVRNYLRQGHHRHEDQLQEWYFQSFLSIAATLIATTWKKSEHCPLPRFAGKLHTQMPYKVRLSWIELYLFVQSEMTSILSRLNVSVDESYSGSRGS